VRVFFLFLLLWSPLSASLPFVSFALCVLTIKIVKYMICHPDKVKVLKCDPVARAQVLLHFSSGPGHVVLCSSPEQSSPSSRSPGPSCPVIPSQARVSVPFLFSDSLVPPPAFLLTYSERSVVVSSPCCRSFETLYPIAAPSTLLHFWRTAYGVVFPSHSICFLFFWS